MPLPNDPQKPQKLRSDDCDVSNADIVACLKLLDQVWPQPLTGHHERRNADDYFRSDVDRGDEEFFADPAINRFIVRERVGEGGFGIVFLAYDTQLNRDVAIKVPRAHLLSANRAREQFLHEARAAALLDHPGIVPVYEVIEAGEAVLIVSAHCSGESLATWLHDRGAIEARSAAWIVAQLADAVRHAHSRGVLHRDLKPANVLLDSSELTNEERAIGFRPKLTDFGLAKIIGAQTRESMSQFGTAHYMSPEQVLGRTKDVGVQSEVFSLGVILYELLTGLRPFEGDALVTMRQIVDNEPKSVATICPSVPLDLVTICHKCLEKEPAARYPTVEKLHDDLLCFLRGEAVAARPLSLPGRVLRWTIRRPMLAGMTIAMLMTVGTGLGGIIWQWRRAEVNREIAVVHRAAAEEQAALAERHLRQAEQTLQDFAWLLEEKILWAEKSDVLDADAYQRLEAFYVSLSDATSNSLRQPLLAAMESFRGREDAQNKKFDEAREHFGTALQLWREIIRRDPQRRAFRRAYALCLHGASLVPISTPLDQRSELPLEAELLFGADPTNPTDATGLLEYVDLLIDLAHSYEATDRFEEAMSTLDRAMPIAERLTSLYPTDEHRTRNVKLYWQIATVWKKSRHPKKGQASLESAVAALERWGQVRQLSSTHRQAEAEMLTEIGVMLRESRQFGDARKRFEAALEVTRGLPADPQRASQIAAISKELGLLLLETKETTVALEVFAGGRTALEEVTKSRQLSPVETRNWGFLNYQCGRLYREAGNGEAAYTALSAAASTYDDSDANFSPINREVRIATAESHAILADLQIERNMLDDALAAKRRALEIYRKLASRQTAVDNHARNRADQLKKEIAQLETRIQAAAPD